MRPRGVLAAVACVLSWTAADLAAQDSALPFSVERPSLYERRQLSLAEGVIGIRDSVGGCGRWLVDLLVPIGDRLVHVSSVGSRQPAPITVEGVVGRQSVLAVRCPGRVGYSLHGPFEWQAAQGLSWLDFLPRRTVRVSPGAGEFSPGRLSLIMSQEGPVAASGRCQRLAQR